MGSLEIFLEVVLQNLKRKRVDLRLGDKDISSVFKIFRILNKQGAHQTFCAVSLHRVAYLFRRCKANFAHTLLGDVKKHDTLRVVAF